MLFTRYKRLLCFFLFSLSSSAIANEDGNEQLQLSGFATLGVVTSDSDHHGYRKSVGSNGAVYSGEIDFKQHSLLGLQADWNISSSFDFVYQGVLRDLPEPSFDRYTTLAFIRYELDTNWSFRLGRTAPDIFLLTEYRDVDFSYTWATAPNEVYGIVPYRSIDGIDITYNKRALGGIFTGKIFTGSSEAEISASTIVQEVNIEDIIGISLSFDHFDWVIHAKHTQVKIANEPESNLEAFNGLNQIPDFLWPNAQTFAQSIVMEGKQVTYSSVSGQYQWNSWLATGELSIIDSESDVVPKITSGYTALSYQVDAHQFYGIYAYTDSRTYAFNEPGVNEAILEDVSYGTNYLMNFYAPNQETISLGWRWDLTNNMASSVQWNYTTLSEGGSTLWFNKSEAHDEEDKVNTFLFTLSMVF
jgi:hypothetical protein